MLNASALSAVGGGAFGLPLAAAPGARRWPDVGPISASPDCPPVPRMTAWGCCSSWGSFKIRAKTGHKPRVHRGWAVSGKVFLLGRPGASARPLKIGAFFRNIGATFPGRFDRNGEGPNFHSAERVG